jgi:hypothetical protein
MSLFDVTTTDMRARMRATQLKSMLDFIGGDHACFQLIARIDALKALQAALKEDLGANEHLSDVGRAAQLQEWRASIRDEVTSLRSRLEALTPQAPQRTAPPEPSSVDIAIAARVASMGAVERNALQVRLLRGEEQEVAASLARCPGAVSNLSPVVRERLAARLNPQSEEESSRAAGFPAEQQLHQLTASELDDFEKSIQG